MLARYAALARTGKPTGNIEHYADCARTKYAMAFPPKIEPDGGQQFAAFADQMRYAVSECRNEHLHRIQYEAEQEGIEPPAKYRAASQAQGGGLTGRVRDVLMDVAIDKVRRGNVGRSWKGEFVPEAVAEAIPLIIPLFGSAVWWIVGAFVKWILIKFALIIVEAFLRKLVGFVPGASIDGNPQQQITAWAASGGMAA